MKVKIGNTTYKITFAPTTTGCDGSVRYSSQNIVIGSDLGKDQKKSTLAHEILHTMLIESGIYNYIRNLDQDAEETIVCGMELMFTQFLEKYTCILDGLKSV